MQAEISLYWDVKPKHVWSPLHLFYAKFMAFTFITSYGFFFQFFVSRLCLQKFLLANTSTSPFNPPQNNQLLQRKNCIQLGSSHNVHNSHSDVSHRRLKHHYNAENVVNHNHRIEFLDWIHWHNLRSSSSKDLSWGGWAAVSANKFINHKLHPMNF